MSVLDITAQTEATSENLLSTRDVTLDTNTITVEPDVCYLKNTKIMIFCNGKEHMVKINNLNVGDTIVSYGNIKNSYSKIKWIGHYTVSNPQLNNYPVCFKKGSLNSDNTKIVPDRDVWVSQKHRICHNGEFTCVSNLINNDSIYIDKNFKSVTYYHLETEKHNIIDVCGIKTETFDEPPGKSYKYKFN